MKKFFSLLKRNKLIMPFVSLIVTGLMLVASSLAWFSMVDRVDGGGMTVGVDNRFITFSDEITVVRGVAAEGGGSYTQTVVYHKGEDEKKYYEYKDGVFVRDEEGNKIPFEIKGLFPGEYLDIKIAYKCSANLAGTKYRLYFTNITDSNGKFTVKDKELSILGIYRWNVLDKDGAEPAEKHWFSEYTVTDNADGSQTVEEKNNGTVELKTEIWPNVEEFVSSTIRLSVDLEQYAKLKGTTSNLLSEKQFSIGRLGIGMGES